MSTESKAFMTFVDLDTATTFCPCGSSFTHNDGRPSDDYKAWEATHRAHITTDEVQNHITDDGMRCLTPDHPRTFTTKLR